MSGLKLTEGTIAYYFYSPRTPSALSQAARIDLVLELLQPLRDENGDLIRGPLITTEEASKLLEGV